MPLRHAHRKENTAAAAHDRKGDALRAIFNRNFNVVALLNLLVMTAYYMAFVTGAAYVRQVYAVSLSVAGFASGIMVLGCLAGRFASGNLLSFFGCRAVLFSGLLLYSGSIAGFFLVSSLPVLFAQRLLVGIGVGVIGSATGTIAAYVVPSRHHGLGISLFSMSSALALALGPLLGIQIVERLGYASVIQTALGMGIICLAVFAGLGTLPRMQRRQRPIWELNSYIDPRVVRFSLVALVASLSYGCVQVFMTSFAAERGLAGAASLFFLFYAASALGTRPLLGHLLDVRGENIIFYPTLALTALSMVLLAYAESGWVLLCAGILLGVGFGNFQSSGQAVALTLVTRSRFAQATTTFFIFFDLGIGVGPYLFGSLVPVTGYRGMYIALALAVTGAMGIYYWVHGRKVA